MTWIKRKADEHRCEEPSLADAYPGDIWQCPCSEKWEVFEHQFDGLYLKRVPRPVIRPELREVLQQHEQDYHPEPGV